MRDVIVLLQLGETPSRAGHSYNLSCSGVSRVAVVQGSDYNSRNTKYFNYILNKRK